MTHHTQEAEHAMDRGFEQPMQQGQPMQSQQGQPMQSQQSQPMQFEYTLTRDMRVALHDFVEASTVCNWCADECLGDMEECARVCRDVADLAALNAQFLARDSVFGADLAETFAYAAEECVDVCSQFSEPHCRECVSALRRAIDSTWAMLESLQHIPQQGQQSIPQGQQKQYDQQPREQQQPMSEGQQY